jgi:UDP-N-acetylmuramoyl-tripeptide--D-alanyl-D-alanine ligase
VNGLDPALARPALFDIAEVAAVTGGVVHGASVGVSGVATDTRKIATGDLFVALKGERFDGHDYVMEAARNGAAAALVERSFGDERDIPQLVVPDAKRALGTIASWWRQRFSTPLLALTGSNGKTTVKEMVAAILYAHCGGRDTVLATEGNLNNDIGVPLMLLRLRERHRYAVIEMGMNHLGEIDYLTHMATPTVALVTNAHRAHIGMLGSIEAIAQAKGEVYGGLKPHGIALVNEDDAYAGYWKQLNKERRVITFGTQESADIRGMVDGAQVRFVTPTDAFAVTLQVPGEHNARNAIAACAAAFALDIAPRSIQSGLAAYAGTKGRLQSMTSAQGARIVDDTYNANPESMKAAIRVLADAPGRKVFVMGDMGELGDAGAPMHAEVGAFARGAGIDRLLALGPLSVHAAEAFGDGGVHHADFDALMEAVRAEDAAGTTILVKGSRFMRMERAVDRLACGGARAA